MKRMITRDSHPWKNRLFVMLTVVCGLFLLLSVRLFYLQIIKGEEYLQKMTTSVLKTVPMPAARGGIYDRYGRPLAGNRVAYSVKIDDSIALNLSEHRNRLVSELYNGLIQDGFSVPDTLPITQAAPYSFQIEGGKKAEEAWKIKNGLPSSQKKATAEETIAFFSEKFNLQDTMSMPERRALISLHLSLDDKNLMLATLIRTLDAHGETLVDDLPITPTAPYTFLFQDNESKERAWKQSVAMQKEELLYSADETIVYLQDFFGIPKTLPEPLVRKMITLRYALYLERYRKYQPITAAFDVSDQTLAAVEESQDVFPGIRIDTDSLREYPGGPYYAHITGFIRKMSEEDYAEYKDDKTPAGDPVYNVTDIVGKSGVEKLYERELNGTDGEMLVEVDSLGRRINTLDTEEPIAGQDVFLTLDARLQEAAYNSLEDRLAQVQKQKLNSGAISTKQLFVSMLNANTISLDKMAQAQEGNQHAVYAHVLAERPDITLADDEERTFAKQIITGGIERGDIPERQMLLILYEQGVLNGDDGSLEALQNGIISVLGIINSKLDSGELAPSQTALDPSTGSVVVSKVDSGETLALVTYPSYDNNRLVNHFDNAYYNALLRDPTTPLVNRPLKEKKAPGSTFKMITALAGLETGILTPSTLIQDQGYFTKAGTPYAKCLIYTNQGRTHGSINVSTALEVSCNYFFYETAYRMGNASNGTTENSISTLNEYMEAFGLNDYVGMEIGETQPNMASPQFKERTIKAVNPDATVSQTRWTDGDSIRAAIGQSVNNYTAANMNKYIATLANGGTRYRMHLISQVTAPDGTRKQIEEEVENILTLVPSNLEAVYKGMLMVTSGSKGTLRHIFSDFPIKVAAKSGTAQDNLYKNSHTWFVGFAPFDDPQIAVTVMIPFGEATGSPAAVVAREVIAEYMGLNAQPHNTYLETRLTP